MIKQKKCEGTGMAKGYGCGKMLNVENRVYGLGKMCCYGEWLFGSENGKMKLDKALRTAKVIVKKKEKASDKQKRAKLQTKTELERILQQVINSIVHHIDKGCLCISSQKPIPKGQHNAGHFWSRGAYPNLRFNLDNIFLQSVHDNLYLSGNPIGFLGGLRSFYGENYCEYVSSLKSNYRSLKLSQDEIREFTVKSREVLQELKKADLTYTAEERITLRSEINKRIGIYK